MPLQFRIILFPGNGEHKPIYDLPNWFLLLHPSPSNISNAVQLLTIRSLDSPRGFELLHKNTESRAPHTSKRNALLLLLHRRPQAGGAPSGRPVPSTRCVHNFLATRCHLYPPPPAAPRAFAAVAPIVVAAPLPTLTHERKRRRSAGRFKDGE